MHHKEERKLLPNGFGKQDRQQTGLPTPPPSTVLSEWVARDTYQLCDFGQVVLCKPLFPHLSKERTSRSHSCGGVQISSLRKASVNSKNRRNGLASVWWKLTY